MQKLVKMKIEDNKQIIVSKKFNCLSTWISNKGEEDKEIDKDQKRGRLTIIMKSKRVSRGSKIRIYRTVIRPTVLYGCESWVMNKKGENQLGNERSKEHIRNQTK